MIPTAEEFASGWAAEYARPDESTNRRRASAIKPFAAYFGDRPLDSITRAEARKFAQKNPGIARYARALYNDAVDDEIVTDNPFKALRLKCEGRVEVVYPTDEQLEGLIAAAPDESFATMIRFAAHTGLRLGEQLALSNHEIHEDEGYVDVRRQLTPNGTRKLPKGEVKRTALLPADALPVPQMDGLAVWTYTRSEHHEAWKKVRAAVGFTGRWHSLRHKNATMLLNAGATPLDVSIHLGNSPDEITRTYGHPDPGLALDRLRKSLDCQKHQSEGATPHE